MTLDINKFDIAKFKVLNKLNFYIVFILSMSFIIYCSYKNTLGVGDFTISLLLVLISNNNKKDIVSCYNDIIEIKKPHNAYYAVKTALFIRACLKNAPAKQKFYQ